MKLILEDNHQAKIVKVL